MSDNSFFDYFDLVLVTTPTLCEEAFKLRYAIYCEEFQYSPKDCPPGYEYDSFDGRSIQCLLRHRASGMFAGCLRLLLEDSSNPSAPFLFESAYGNGSHNYQRLLKTARREGKPFGEVSRLAIHNMFRRPNLSVNDPNLLVGREYFPLIAFVLALTTVYLGLEINLDSLYAMMEPRFVRLLRRYGMYLHQVDDLVMFHGQARALYRTDRTQMHQLTGQAQELLNLIIANFDISELPDLLVQLRRPLAA